jgi:hypothetical protein
VLGSNLYFYMYKGFYLKYVANKNKDILGNSLLQRMNLNRKLKHRRINKKLNRYLDDRFRESKDIVE